MNSESTSQTQTATLAGGCFWCLEAVFNQVLGVSNVVSGYSGGHLPHPAYHEVTTGRTGHAEVVQLTFDSHQIDFREILEVFFSIHDPTTLNRQGADIGTQYRSAIFYHSPEQKRIAEEIIADLIATKIWDNPIVTEVAPFESFYPAEDYHQEYFTKNPNQPYCQVVINPKLAKFRRKFASRLK